MEQADEASFKVTGDLTIRGVTKPVTVDFELTGTANDPWGNFRIGVEGKGDYQPQGLEPELERHDRGSWSARR